VKINFIKTTGDALIPFGKNDFEKFNSFKEGDVYQVDIKKQDQRTLAQNRSIHLFCTMLSDALNDAGLDIAKTMKQDASIPWSATLIKELMWSVVQKAMFDTSSTTKLDTKQVGEVYDVINRHLSTAHGVSVSFPGRFRG
jgi:hypothetical protein